MFLPGRFLPRVGETVYCSAPMARLASLFGPRGCGLFGAVGTTLALSAPAQAQQKTFHLDRLEVPGAPEDGTAVFRPVTNQQNIVYGQFAIGYSLNVLRTRNITPDKTTIRNSSVAVVKNQLSLYGSAGFQFLDRASVGVTFPVTPFQNGENPNYSAVTILNAGQNTTKVSTDGPSVSDLRLDFRGVLMRSVDRRKALGAQFSLFAPTGNGSSGNFGGDGQTSAMILISGEYDVGAISLVANTGVHFRPRNSINDPVQDQGLGVSSEWRWTLGGFLPLKDGKYRLGVTFFGQTGLQVDDPVVGSTLFTGRNSPIEAQFEARTRFGATQRYWAGATAGTAVARGYGAPDLRLVVLVGAYMPILESDPKSPREAMREKWKSEHRNVDTDGDGIPDDLDACPNDPEDHLGNDPNDGCPQPPDRDGDGIPDNLDKCPDVPEDKDGIDDGDGCPEDDADKDGVLDAVDACPKEPGAPNSDPKKNGCPQFIKLEGGQIRILQQVHFATGSAQILADSFPMLQEIVSLLNANPSIKRLSIEGHTDNRGNAEMNKTLSQNRANSVMNHMIGKGIAAGRLEAHGYGLEKPIADNNTDDGRATNRRVEFKITEEDDTNKAGN